MAYEYLDNVGMSIDRDKSLFKSIPLLAHNVGQSLVDKITDNLKKHTASGLLKQSVEFKVTEVGKDKFKVSILMNDYWKYLDKGVKGKVSTYPSASNSPYKYTTKFPPKKAIANFLGVKATSGMVQGHHKKSESISEGQNKLFFVRRSIFRKGLRGTGFLSSVVTEGMLDKVNEELGKMVQQKIIVEII